MSDPASAPFLVRLFRWGVAQLWWTVRVFVVTLLAMIADEIPPLRALHDHLLEHPQPWLGLTIGSAGVGWGLLWYVWLTLIFKGHATRGRQRSPAAGHARAAARFRREQGQRQARPRIIPRSLPGSASMAEIKAAFASGTWLSDPAMRPFCLGLIGVVFAVVGSFGFFVVVGPPSAQIVSAAAIMFVLWMLAQGFRRA